MNEQINIHIGLVEFAEPTLLLVGEASSFSSLAEQIAGRREVMLHCASIKDHVSLCFLPATLGDRLVRQGDRFEWQISEPQAQSVARQLRELAASDRPAHAYLDPLANESAFQIVASLGEYDPAKVFDG